MPRKLIKDAGIVRLSPVLQVKRTSETGTIEGYASTFWGQPDSYGHVIEPGAFSRALGEHKEAGTLPAMLWAHDMADVIGRWDEISEDAKGLKVRGSLNLKTSAGADAHEHLKAGDVSGLSIGFWLYEDGYRYEDGAVVLTAIRLAEVSVVAIPANGNARVSSVKSIGSRDQLIEALRGAGLSRTAAKRVASGGWSALAGAPADDDPSPDDFDLATLRKALAHSADNRKGR